MFKKKVVIPVIGVLVLCISFFYIQFSRSAAPVASQQKSDIHDKSAGENGTTQSNTPQKGLLQTGHPVEKEVVFSSDFKPQVNVTNLSLTSKYLGINFASPSYINENFIYSEVDDSTIENKQESYILQIDKKNQSEAKIYTAPNRRIINSLVGSGDHLFWIEYERSRDDKLNLPWQLLSMDLSTKEIKKITEGIGQDQIDPPILRIHDDKVTWITKEIVDGIVYSHIYYMKEDLAPKKIKSITLNEKNRTQSQGVFLGIQRPVSEGILIQETVFSPNEAAGKSDKLSRISLYPYDGGDSRIIVETKSYVDYTMNKDWFVLAEDGAVNVYSLSTGKLVYQIKQEKATTPTDSPFIYNNTLFYRTSMYSISALDLNTGEHTFISKKGSITSKLFNSSNKIGFSYMPGNNSDPNKKGYVEFTILEF